MKKNFIIGAFALMSLTSCGMGKLISVRPVDPAVTAQKLEALKQSGQQQIDYAMSIISVPSAYAEALKNYPVTAHDGTDLRSMIAAVGPDLAKKLKPVLQEYLSKVDSGEVLFGGKGFVDYLKRQNDMDLRFAVNDALRTKGRIDMYNAKAGGNTEEGFATRKILETVYFIMEQK